MRRTTHIVASTIVPLFLLLPGRPSFAYLIIHPENPHYFEETTTGKAVMITGYGAIVPNSLDFDDQALFRGSIQRWRVNYARVWHFTPWGMQNAVWPWAASDEGGGYWGGLGGSKLDMDVWNETAWQRMRTSLRRAANSGAYAQIMLFDRCGMSPASDTRWGNNPWASNNNVNGLELPDAEPPNDGTPDFYDFTNRPNLRHQQERYIRKLIDETIGFDNVIYEVENEHWEQNSPAFGDHYGRFVKDYIRANYRESPRLTSYSSLLDDLEACYTRTSIDIINKHYGDDAETPGVINDYLQRHWHFNKPVNIDEFANGLADYGTLRRICWEIITSGGHFHIEDAAAAARPLAVVDNINRFKAMANWSFISASPHKDLIVSGDGFCLTDPGKEYVCYFPSGGAKVLSLVAGVYRSAWWNPRTGGFYEIARSAHDGGDRCFVTPDGNDWVLHVTTRPVLKPVLESRYATGLVIDGSVTDWNLIRFTTPIRAGEVGKGDVAVAGYGGYEGWTFYHGGFATGGQFPPEDPSDHAVRVYSLHDKDYLYFLIHIIDTDVQSSNAVTSARLNDCVEFYLDPGNRGGSVSLRDSASCVQLVIDAANRKSVYMADPRSAARVLGGVSSAASVDAGGWRLEVRIRKDVFDPVIHSASGQIGVDFVFRDNDANEDALSSAYSWCEPETSGSFPSSIPDRWGTLDLISAPIP